MKRPSSTSSCQRATPTLTFAAAIGHGVKSRPVIIRAAKRPWLDVIELEEPARGTTFAGFVLERALLTVALEHLGSHGPRHAARLGRPHASAWAGDFTEALLLQLLEENIDGGLEHNGELAGRVSVTHQIARAFELVAELDAGSQLNLETNLRERLDPRGRRWRCCGRKEGQRATLLTSLLPIAA